MTDHRAEAEQHLKWAANTDAESFSPEAQYHTAVALVHATLAAGDPVELVRMARREMAERIAAALRPRCSDCAAIALGLGEQPAPTTPVRSAHRATPVPGGA